MGIVRLLLAIAVFNSHFPLTDLPVVDGHEAVLAFFAISGFYMALILDGTYSSARSFYMGRFLSLYPIFAFAMSVSVALLVTLDIHPMATLDNVKSILAHPAGFLSMVSTAILPVGQELLFSFAITPENGLHFLTEAGRTGLWHSAPLIQAWSLSLETVFYALAPLLVVMRTRTLAWLVGLSLCAKVLVVAGGFLDVVFLKRFFPIEFWLFGSGILAYRFYKTLPETPALSDSLIFAALVTIIAMVGEAPPEAAPFALPLATLFSLPFVFRRFRDFSWDRVVGKVSYPFYLIHFTVIAIFETTMEEPLGWDILAVSLAAAVAVHALFAPGIGVLKQAVRLPLGDLPARARARFRNP
ncbi:acyltransferase family protein [Pseudodesulfovibrio portus]|uniref:Acyltransferase 3 domain-containing protein n=1 Tax=Pseudodesulfovibrio portus TaxID=231439 RepID=A0ABM8AU66_9BACT|nr:acyltransferase family protein [Pseudodesulfovibrio portus]BDQ35036.1 hypothetical protein JCM14722_25780 [Pseudodesulfovibrio portus]